MTMKDCHAAQRGACVWQYSACDHQLREIIWHDWTQRLEQGAFIVLYSPRGPCGPCATLSLIKGVGGVEALPRTTCCQRLSLQTTPT